jgi:SAM-dependent methyltransferase
MKEAAMKLLPIAATIALAAMGTIQAPAAEPDQRAATPARAPDVRYEPSPRTVVRAMLKLAGVTERDVVYDLGSGDGRIPIAAARDFGARAVGIDIDPKLVERARANAREARVADRVTFRNEDLFAADVSDATVVTLFLLPEANLKLRPRLLAELRPGTRVVSHYHDMGDWKPDRRIRIQGRSIYLWTIPPR